MNKNWRQKFLSVLFMDVALKSSVAPENNQEHEPNTTQANNQTNEVYEKRREGEG